MHRPTWRWTALAGPAVAASGVKVKRTMSRLMRSSGFVTAAKYAVTPVMTLVTLPDMPQQKLASMMGHIPMSG